jgi:hypothetical protein
MMWWSWGIGRDRAGRSSHGNGGILAILTVFLCGGLAWAASWTITTAPAHPVVPGHLAVTVTGPGPAPTLRVIEPDVHYQERMKPAGPGRWKATAQLVSPGRTTLDVVVHGRVVQSTSVPVGESGSAVVARVIGGAVLLLAFLWTWRRTRRSLG